MHVLFLVTEPDWSPRARAFLLAARGLTARGHDVVIACATDCPVQLRATESNVPIVSINPESSTAGSAWQLRKAIQEREIDVAFVHTDAELLIASSAIRPRPGGGAVIQRTPPFAMAAMGPGSRLPPPNAPTGLRRSS